MVEDVERIHTELDRRNLTDGKVFLDRKVRIEQMRTKDTVPAYVSNLVQSRRGEGCSQRLCLEVDQTISRETREMRLECTGVSVDLTWNAARDLITARAIAERKRKATGVVKHWAELPSSDNLVGQSICMAKEHLVLAKRKLIQAINNNLLLSKLAVAAFDSRLAPGGIASGVTGCALPGVIRVK